MLARYFMYSQVYFHPVRRIYDTHLMDFLKEWLNEGVFSTTVIDHLNITDNEVTAAMLKAAFDADQKGHLHARRVVRREHFKTIYQRTAEDVQINPDSGRAVFQALCDELGSDHFRHDQFGERDAEHDFQCIDVTVKSLHRSQCRIYYRGCRWCPWTWSLRHDRYLIRLKIGSIETKAKSSNWLRERTMNRLERAALLLRIVERAREQGSSCGQTHLQKSSVPRGVRSWSVWERRCTSLDARSRGRPWMSDRSG